MNDPLRLATDFARLGFRVFPLQPKGKVPLPGLKWKQEATSDREQIIKWWKANPNANIGLPAGGNRLVVLDVDVDSPPSRFSCLTGVMQSHLGRSLRSFWVRQRVFDSSW